MATVAARPSSRGMRMSISTTSGRHRRTASTAPAPSSASPTTVMSPADSRIIRSPARTRASSSMTSARITACDRSRSPRRRCGGAARAAPRRAARRRPATRRRGSARTPASRRRGRPARAVRAGRCPTPAGARRSATGRRFTTSTVTPRAPSPVIRTDGRGAAGVLVHVGQRLLHDPMDRAGDGVGQLADLHRQLGPHPGRPRRLDDRARCRRRAAAVRGRCRRRPTPARSTPSTSRRSSIASRAVVRISAGGLPDLLRPGRGVDLQRAGVHGDQRHLVGQDVVHLAGDAGPLGEHRLLRPELLLLLGLRRPVAQRVHEVAAGADVRAGRREQRGLDEPGHDEPDPARRAVGPPAPRRTPPPRPGSSATSTRSRRRIASENSPTASGDRHRRDGEHDDADGA